MYQCQLVKWWTDDRKVKGSISKIAKRGSEFKRGNEPKDEQEQLKKFLGLWPIAVYKKLLDNLANDDLSAPSDEHREGDFSCDGRRRSASLHGAERLLDGRRPAERLLEGDVPLPGLAEEEEERPFDLRTRIRRQRHRGQSLTSFFFLRPVVNVIKLIFLLQRAYTISS